MFKYILKRILSGILTLFVILTLVFFMMRMIGGNPVYSLLKGTDPSAEDIEYYTHLYGFDRPILVQYGEYLLNIFRGDWGVSFFNQRGVYENMLSRWEPTLMIALVSFVLMVCVGIPLGILCATHRNSLMDYSVSTVTLFFQTIPSFWLGLLLVYYLTFKVKLFPMQGYTAIKENGILNSIHCVFLPSLALMAHYTASIARQMRSSFLGVMKEDYIRTAKAKGVSGRKIIFGHALKNSLIPVITYFGPMLAFIVTGSMVVEQIFAVPGIGRQFVSSITNRDYMMIMGTTIFLASLIVIMNLITDILYKVVDPRIEFD